MIAGARPEATASNARNVRNAAAAMVMTTDAEMRRVDAAAKSGNASAAKPKAKLALPRSWEARAGATSAGAPTKS